MIFSLGLPELTANIVPPIGVNKSGVSAATPIKPNFLQMVTNLRLLGENVFRFLKNLCVIFSRIQFPKNVNSNTTVIIPATVTSIVTINGKPAA